MEFTKEEKRILICAIAGVCIFLFGIFMTQGMFLLRPVVGIFYGEQAPKDPVRYCHNKKYKNSAFCHNRKVVQKEKWRGVTQNARGKSTAFSLHSRSK